MNAVEMRTLRSMCGMNFRDRVRNSLIRALWKEDVVIRSGKGRYMLRWLGIKHGNTMGDNYHAWQAKW